MSRTRTVVTLLAAAAAAVPLGLAPPAAAADADPGYTVTALKVPVPVGDRTCTVDADLYKPDAVSKGHPAPAVLTTNGFGGSKDDGSTDGQAKAFASRGYVALAYSGLGFGDSGCPISLDDPKADGKAASKLVDTLADTGYVALDGPHDPSVGMIGGSYGGAVQLAAASVDHRIDALVPMITWNDLAYSLDPNNTAQTSGVSSNTPGVYKSTWTSMFFLLGEAGGLLHPGIDPSRLGGDGCLHFTAPACDTVHTLYSGRYPADKAGALLTYARSVSPVSYLKNVKAPTLFVQGERDTLFNLNEATASYRTLKQQGTPAKLIWQSWGHSGGMNDPAPGELDLSGGKVEDSYVGRRILAWFDRYLKHDTSADTGPGFAYYRDWNAADPSRTYATASSPDAVGTPRTYYLSADGTLAPDRSAAVDGSRRYANSLLPTSHSDSPLGLVMGSNDANPYDLPGTHLDWSSAPLAADTDVVGAPKATLTVTSPAAEKTQYGDDASGKLVLFAKVYDVAPNGKKSLIHGLTAPVRVPDATEPFTVTLPSIVHRFPAGHRIRFTVAASDDSYYGNRGIKPVSVTTAPGRTNQLTLPVVATQ